MILKKNLLTKKQARIYEFIIDHINNKYYSPTYREIAEKFKMTSKGAYDHVSAIKKKGYIKAPIETARSFIIDKKMYRKYKKEINFKGD